MAFLALVFTSHLTLGLPHVRILSDAAAVPAATSVDVDDEESDNGIQ